MEPPLSLLTESKIEALSSALNAQIENPRSLGMIGAMAAQGISWSSPKETLLFDGCRALETYLEEVEARDEFGSEVKLAAQLLLSVPRYCWRGLSMRTKGQFMRLVSEAGEEQEMNYQLVRAYEDEFREIEKARVYGDEDVSASPLVSDLMGDIPIFSAHLRPMLLLLSGASSFVLEEDVPEEVKATYVKMVTDGVADSEIEPHLREEMIKTMGRWPQLQRDHIAHLRDVVRQEGKESDLGRHAVSTLDAHGVSVGE